MSPAVLWVFVALPAAVGAGLCLAGRRGDRAAPFVAVTTAAIGLVLAAAVAVGRPVAGAAFLPVADFGLAVDALSAVVVPTVAAVALLVLVFAAVDVRESPARFGGLMLLFVAAVSVTATATTLPAVLFAWEVMGAASYALIGFAWREPEKVGAGATAFLTTRAADLGLYLAAGAALAGGSGLDLTDLSGAASPWRDVVAAGILVSALGKAAQLPFSFWLSRAMEGPSPVSALLHSAAMVAMGGYLLLRMSPLLQATAWAGPTTAWAGAVTALVLGAVAVAQRDLKQLLAASTSAQLGFVVLAAGVSSVAGGTAQLIAHAATKALLFLSAGAWLSALGTKQLPALRGAARRWPVVGIAAGIGLLSLAGIAPLSLWAAKDQVLAAARESSIPLYLVGLAAAVLAAAYSGKALWMLCRPPAADADRGYDTEQRGIRHVGGWRTAPLVLLASAAAVLGLLALPPVSGTLRRALGEPDAPTAAGWELALSAALAVLVLLAARRRTWPAPRWAVEWLGLERLVRQLVGEPVLRLAELLARFDDRTLDRGVDAVAGATLRVARAAAVVDAEGIDAAVDRVAGATRRLGAFARRTQTGLLHQYYIQAVGVVGGAVLLLLVVR